MDQLKEKIKLEGYVIDERIVKVDHFINHMLDTKLVVDIGKEFAARFDGVTKIVTIEASGIPFALSTAVAMGNIPIVFARKRESLITGDKVLSSQVYSFTKEQNFTIQIDQEFIRETDRVLIIDDFLATGSAAMGLVDIVRQAGAGVIGFGAVIEKGTLQGRELLEARGIRVESLANIISLKGNNIVFE